MDLIKRLTFEAAHRVPDAPDPRERRLHGHSFAVELVVRGEVDEARGWVLDYAEIKRCFAPLRAQLDHHCLNEVEGLDNPDARQIARWIYERLRAALPLLYAVRVSETEERWSRWPQQPEGG